MNYKPNNIIKHTNTSCNKSPELWRDAADRVHRSAIEPAVTDSALDRVLRSF